jgi:hypothetical protein
LDTDEGKTPPHSPDRVLLIVYYRKCPALDFAEVAMFGLMAVTLATFDIQRQVDENGNEIVPPGDFEHRVIP